MTYRIVLIKSEEGYAAFCPALPGCASQGASENEAVENIYDAAGLWLDSGGVPQEDNAPKAEAELLKEAAVDSLQASVREIDLAMAA